MAWVVLNPLVMDEIPSNRLTSLSEELRMDGTIRLFYDHRTLPKISFGRAIELCGGIEVYNKVCESLLCGGEVYIIANKVYIV